MQAHLPEENKERGKDHAALADGPLELPKLCHEAVPEPFKGRGLHLC